MRTFEWAIEDIVAAYPYLELNHHAAMAVALMMPSSSPCTFSVSIKGFEVEALEGDQEFSLHVSWSSQWEDAAGRIVRTHQRAQIVEGGAIALAALLFAHLMRNSELDVTVVSDRADYWLLQQQRALEISGTERIRELPRRFREKFRQLLENHRGWDGYVVLCCFAESKRAIQWTYHTQSR